jgi:hypothetical protein
MSTPACDENEMLAMVRDVYAKLPFNQLLVLKCSEFA